MAFNVSRKHGRDLDVEQIDILTGLMLQDPAHQTQQEDMGGTALAANVDAINGKTSFGTPFIIESVINAEETGGATLNYAVFDGNSPFKFKVLLAWGVVLDETGTMAADTVQLFQGDGAASESFTAITEAIDCNVDDDDLFGLVAGTAQYDQDAAVIDENESLRIQLALANSSNHEITVKVYILAMRCIADE
jgi:hypothetical protein